MQDTNEKIMTFMANNIHAYILMFKHETDVEPWEDIQIQCEEEEETKSQGRTPKSKNS
jgi:hypothetical protein